MSEPSSVAASRRALGRQLASLRQAAGLSQQDLADAIDGYGRSSVANVEVGRQKVSRDFWDRCDVLLVSGGTLTRSFDLLDDQLRRHHQDEARACTSLSAQHGKRPASGMGFFVDSHKFVPAFIGAELTAKLAAADQFSPAPHPWLARSVTQIQARNADCELYALACGVAMLHVVERRSFPSVASLAAWRWRSYTSVMNWGAEVLAGLLCVEPEAVRPDYVLSFFWLSEPAWHGHDLDTAMRLLSVPSVLINHVPSGTYVDEAERAEQEFFRTGFEHSDLVPFGVQGVSQAYASWSGVSYHPSASARALRVEDLVACELTVQALWCYSNQVLSEIEHGREPAVPGEFGWRFIRAARSRITAARPQETSQHRLMRDAILTTSGLPDRLSAAQEILRECESTGGMVG